MNQYSTRANTRRRRPLLASTRNRIFERDAHTCVYCGFEADQVDHIIPYSYGGTDDDENLAASCRICNMVAGNKVFDTFEEKRAHIRRRYGPYLEQRYRRERRKLSVCADCGKVYSPQDRGATVVLCVECYKRDCDGENGYVLAYRN